MVKNEPELGSVKRIGGGSFLLVEVHKKALWQQRAIRLRTCLKLESCLGG